MSMLVFATNNANKVREVNTMLGDLEVVSLKAINCTEEIPETTGTIPGNAMQKARYVRDNYQVDCFAEDTGLEVDALGGEPGVDTAFYSGSRDADANMQLVIDNLQGKSSRGAQFRTVVALVRDGKEHRFEGICRGTISMEKRGNQGFGYDPVFIPEGYETTFAEMEAKEKNKIRHRKKAVAKLLEKKKKK
ncbi:MAG: RdgB/HAM1 family non-canonical purine NTP pyrophosphatase [Saprospiraceae bacterium]